MVKIIIADAGPLIALAGVNKLEILRELFSITWITTSVKEECTAKTDKDTEQIISALSEGWLREKTWLRLTSPPKKLSGSLGQGEVDTIEWARELTQLTQQKAASLIILDDRLARKYALELGLNFIGTVRLLDIAEQKGLIENAEALIEKISSNGYRISTEILKVIRADNKSS